MENKTIKTEIKIETQELRVYEPGEFKIEDEEKNFTVLDNLEKLRRYKPERVDFKGDIYYAICSDLAIVYSHDYFNHFDDNCFKNKNYFTTEEQAKEYLGYLKNVLGLEE